MGRRKRITILLGAGSVYEATGVSTDSITKRVIKECKCYLASPEDKRKKQSIVDFICKEYWENFGKNDPKYKPYSHANLNRVVKYVNFEDIFHVLEIMSGYMLNPVVKEYSTAYKVFTKIKEHYANIDRIGISSSARKMIDVINDIVSEYDCMYEDKSSYFGDFIRGLEKEYILNVFNLNYDTWVEKSLQSYCDGFKPISGYKGKLQRFSIKDYREACSSEKNTVAHLHGSILFGDAELKRSEINRFALEDSHDCMYKYADYQDAERYRRRNFRSNSNNQAGELIIVSNVITGLMKTDKLLRNPLIEYEHHFYRSLTENDRLLIIGYGFPDKYINSMLWQFQSSNYDKRKVMLITKVDCDDWQPQIEAPLEPSDMMIFSSLMFKEDGHLRRVRFNQVEKGYYSMDGMAALYACGFKKVVEKHMNDVVTFFD